MSQDLDQLTQITALLRERALEAHRQALAESRRIAREIAEIDTMRQAAQSEAMDADPARRSLGADSLWRDWLLQRRAALLRDAALARAREGDTQGRARSAWSRDSAAAGLAEAAAKERQRLRRMAEARRLDAMVILRAAGSDGPGEA